MAIEYTLDVEDVAAARLLAIGIRPRLELALFVAAIAGEFALSVSSISMAPLPLLTGLTASLAAFRLFQINRVREAAAAAFRRNHTLRSLTAASWDDAGITIQPLAALSERILWKELQPLQENGRVILFRQASGQLHAFPKRAFQDKAALAAFRNFARARSRAAGRAPAPGSKSS
jgi:hypothetical protein